VYGDGRSERVLGETLADLIENNAVTARQRRVGG